MNRYLIILLVAAFTVVAPAISRADLFSQTIGDDDNFGGSPNGDTRSPSEQSATDGSQFTDWYTNLYQRTFVFDFGVPITSITQASLETNVYDVEDLMEGEDTVDIQLNIEGYDVPGAFDDVDLSGISDIITFDLLNLLGSEALEDICSDGVITVDFLNAGSFQEFYAIDWVSLSIEEPSPDTDIDGVPDNEDNCPDIPNGPDLGTCVNTATNAVGTTCLNDGECGTGETCSNDQEDRNNNGAGDACDIGTFCRGLADYDQDVDGADVGVFISHFGRSQYNNPCPPDGPSPVPQTGQDKCWDETGTQIDCTSTGHDGEYQRGVPLVTPRFTDNGDGTVTDNQTGLIWMKNADCFGDRIWSHAISECNGLANGSCGLTDGSQVGDWRLANKKEYFSLIHDGYFKPALPNTAGTGQWSEGDPFNNVHQNWYWSSTTYVYRTDWAWDVWIGYGYNNTNSKYDFRHVWCVRGGR